MKALYFNQHGGPEQIRFGDVNNLVVKPGEVLVKVCACALNRLDIWVREGTILDFSIFSSFTPTVAPSFDAYLTDKKPYNGIDIKKIDNEPYFEIFILRF